LTEPGSSGKTISALGICPVFAQSLDHQSCSVPDTGPAFGLGLILKRGYRRWRGPSGPRWPAQALGRGGTDGGFQLRPQYKDGEEGSGGGRVRR